MLPIAPFTLESAVHLIQVALTPVFLLSGIAALLNVYAGRLARVADRLDSLITTHETNGTEADAKTRDEISRLHRRSIVLDTAVVLGTAGAAATCLAIFHWLRLLTYADGTGAMALSAVAMMNVWGLFQYGITAESIAGLLGTVARGFPQWVLVYLVAMTCARWALGKGYVAEKTA